MSLTTQGTSFLFQAMLVISPGVLTPLRCLKTSIDGPIIWATPRNTYGY